MNTTLTDLANALTDLARSYEAINRGPTECESSHVREVLSSILAAIKRLADQVGNETTQTADERPWIPWSGGSCPVADCSQVSVKMRNGCMKSGQACGFSWSHLGLASDIIAFRLAPQDSQE